MQVREDVLREARLDRVIAVNVGHVGDEVSCQVIEDGSRRTIDNPLERLGRLVLA